MWFFFNHDIKHFKFFFPWHFLRAVYTLKRFFCVRFGRNYLLVFSPRKLKSYCRDVWEEHVVVIYFSSLLHYNVYNDLHACSFYFILFFFYSQHPYKFIRNLIVRIFYRRRTLYPFRGKKLLALNSIL